MVNSLMNKTDLIQRVKALNGLRQDERAYLINMVNTEKKYGLLWEDKPEDVEEQLRENLPVIKEVREKFIEVKKVTTTGSNQLTLTDIHANQNNPINYVSDNTTA